MAVYVIASDDISGPKGYKGYVRGVLPLLQKHGGQVLAANSCFGPAQLLWSFLLAAGALGMLYRAFTFSARRVGARPQKPGEAPAWGTIYFNKRRVQPWLFT